MPRECLKIIESKSKVRQSRSKAIVSKVSTSSSTPTVSSDVAELKDMVRALILDKKNQTPAPHPINQPPTFQAPAYQAPVPPAPEKENEPEVTKDTVQPSTKNIQPPVVQTNDQIGEPVVASKTKPTLPYPSRANKEKLREKDNLLASKFMEIFRNLHFELSFADALLHMPKFAPMFRKLLNDKDKMIELTKTPMNECLAWADLGASINLMPLSIWKELSLPALTKTRMILELADRTISTPTGIAEDVFVKVGAQRSSNSHHADFVIDLAYSFTHFGRSEFLMKRSMHILNMMIAIPPGVDGIYDSEGDTVYLEELLSVINSDPNLPPSPVCEINVPEKVKSSCEDPPDLELKDLPSHLKYAFLEASHLNKCSKGVKPNLVLNWEKCHFMVKKGIVLGHKISKSGIEVDKSKVDVIAKLPHPTTVKGAENLAADNLSRHENPHQSKLEKKEITETFPLETLGIGGGVYLSGNDNAPMVCAILQTTMSGFLFVIKRQKLDILKSLPHRPTGGHYGLVEAIDSLVPLDEHFATFRGTIFKKESHKRQTKHRWKRPAKQI
ncbi:reverse transcriptase domain-containing protein [Tanacetum coccineum]